MSDHSKRGWLQRLGLQADAPDPEEWVVVARGRLDAESRSNYAARTIELLTEAGINAEARPYVLPDDNAVSVIRGANTPNAEARTRIAVVTHRRDQARAEEVLRSRPKAVPISDEELTRLAAEAAPPPPE